MDPYETLGITPAFSGDLRALRNRLVKRYFEAGESPDEERMKAINLAYAMLLDRPRVAAPLEIVSDALPPARAGGPYRVALAASGGVEPYTWEAVLPRGLVLDGDGVLSGRVERTLAFTLRVTDRDGRLVERGLVVHIEPVPQQADPVAVDAPGSDVQPAASREPIAVPQRRSVDPAAVATAIVVAGAAVALLPWFLSVVVVAALAVVLGAARRTRPALDPRQRPLDPEGVRDGGAPEHGVRGDPPGRGAE